MTTRIVVHEDDGTQTDITEGVQVLYDHLIASMDWGSGFLDNEEARRVLEVAQTAGFLIPDEARTMFEKYIRTTSMAECQTCHRQIAYSYPQEKWQHFGDGGDGPATFHEWLGWRVTPVPVDVGHDAVIW